MKNLVFVFLVLLLSGCGVRSTVVSKTNVDGEYVVRASDQKGPLSSLSAAREGAIRTAIETCKEMGKVYKKGYSIDQGLSYAALGQVPESTLYFRCVDRK